MKKFLIAAAGLSAIAAAAPAAAQYNNGYGYPQQGYGNNYGYNNNQQGLVRAYLVRADQLRQRVERSDNRNRISEREAARLRYAAIDLQRRTRDYARNGLSDRERYDLDQRIARLQQAIRYERSDGNNNRWGRVNDRDRDGVRDRRDGWVDQDRDGMDDRREDDRGRYPG